MDDQNFKWVPLHEILENPENPRTISDEKLQALVKSIIDFPFMLLSNPPKVNAKMIVLGGNMRRRALVQVLNSSPEELDAMIEAAAGKLKSASRKKLVKLFKEKFAAGEVPVQVTDYFTADAEDELVIKDNLPYGQWDFDMLFDKWEREQLLDFGMELPEMLTATGPADLGDTLDDENIAYKAQYGVIVICPDEQSQEKIFDALREQGYECKIVVT